MMTRKTFGLLVKTVSKLAATLVLLSISGDLVSQCSPGQVSGVVYEDKNNNGVKEASESSLNGILVSVFDESGTNVASQQTSSTGAYSFTGLTNGKKYRVEFNHSNVYNASFVGSNSGTSVQFVTAPACGTSLGLVKNTVECAANPMIFTTCFVQGNITNNIAEPTIIGLDHNFTSTTSMTKFASHGETGSVWGLAWKSSTNELFSSSFVKMYAGLSYGHDAILKTTLNGSSSTTSKFIKLSELGINITPLSVTNIADCAYSAQVGRTGLGAMVLSPGEDHLYVVNISGKSIVKIATENPTAANTVSYSIPDPGTSGEYYPFAMKYHNSKIYVGVTYKVTEGGIANNSGAVLEFDPSTGNFTTVFTTPYLKGYWSDADAASIITEHWLTDIDFTDDGNMILSLSDRVGHKYCKSPSNRLDHQFPDILMVWNDNGTWKLESNATAGTLTGNGANNNQGPNGGEFFGDDHWPANPVYHPEVALGSVFVLPGTNSVVATVYDPDINSYSGGLHKYNTKTGAKITSIELYTETTDPVFGKATGFGEIVGRCGLPSAQIGNLVWFDARCRRSASFRSKSLFD
jgi:hypothetical protein